MKTNRFFYTIVMLLTVLALSLALLPISAQDDDWPEGCELPDLEEAMNAAESARADGDTVAYLDALRNITDTAHVAYVDCFATLARYSDDLQGMNLTDVNLQGAFLPYVNLEGADLTGANLQEVFLAYANLQGANLREANLQEAGLGGANLQGAILVDANLQGVLTCTGKNGHTANLRQADLRGADLRGAFLDASDVDLQQADLRGADLRGASLHEANLMNTDLTHAIFDETTVLPDAVSQWEWDDQDGLVVVADSYWTPDTDMARFADPEHPDFWDPCVELEHQPWYCEDGGG